MNGSPQGRAGFLPPPESAASSGEGHELLIRVGPRSVTAAGSSRRSSQRAAGRWIPCCLVLARQRPYNRTRMLFYYNMPDEPRPASLNPPKQSRSQRTLERIVAASLELLATEGPSGLTVHAVVEKADSSIGSFYARFKGKDDLLDYLSERVWQDALDRWNEALVSRDWSQLELGDLVEGAVGLLIDAQRSRSAYLKALDWVVGRRNDTYETFRSHLLVGLGELLLERRAAILHENAALAVRLGLRGILGVIDAEFRAVEDRLDHETLLLECRNLLLGYLMCGINTGRGGGVDFFDVWG